MAILSRFKVGEFCQITAAGSPTNPYWGRGRYFRGYIDATRFDKAIFSAAAQIRKTRSFGFESDVMGCCWLALAVSGGCSVLFDLDRFDWIPLGVPTHLIWFVALLVWGGRYTMQGRCPECGGILTTAQYERPSKDKGT